VERYGGCGEGVEGSSFYLGGGDTAVLSSVQFRKKFNPITSRSPSTTKLPLNTIFATGRR